MNRETLATFAKQMICPPSLYDVNARFDFSAQGLEDFQKFSFRHNSSNYFGNSPSSPETLLEVLKNSIAKHLSNKKNLLLLSDGKDSLTLALAFSDLGIQCHTLTLLRRNDASLKAYITQICQKLGHIPNFINVDEILLNFNKKDFVSSFAKMGHPVLDQGYLFFLFGLSSFFRMNAFDASKFRVIDGLGNDETLGYIPSQNQYRSFVLAKLSLWKFLPPFAPQLKWYIRSPAESHGNLSALASIFPIPSSYDLNVYFKKIPQSLRATGVVDFRAFARGCFHDHLCMMGKTITAARHLGVDCEFPWTYPEISQHCFNLPLEAKFNFKELKNKLILRQLLSDRLGWNQQKRGVDLFFDIKLADFKKNILDSLLPDHLIQTILKKKFLPLSVKKRAALELLNFYYYASTHDLSPSDIDSILYEK